MRARLPGVDDGMAYSVYLCAGLLTWGLFAEITMRSQNMFLENANLLKKISFPRICLPVIVLFNAGINFAIIIGLFLGFLLITGRLPGMALLALIPLLALQMMFCCRAGDDSWRIERVLSRCRAIFRHLPAILVLADADRLPDEHPAGMGAALCCNSTR